MLDQALSSLTNFVLGVLVARSVTTQEFGSFSLVLVTYWTALAVTRGLTSQPLVIRFSHVSQPEWRGAVAAATGTSLLIGAGLGGACMAASLFAPQPTRDAFLGLGLILPVLLVQDCWRFGFMAAGRIRAALINDLVLAAVVVPLLVAFSLAGRISLPGALAAWGAGAAAASATGWVQSAIRPVPRSGRAWLRSQRDLASRYVAEAIVSAGSTQASTYVVAGFGGLASAGILRAGQLLLSPLHVLYQGVHLIGVPEGARALRQSQSHFVLLVSVLAIMLALVVTIWAVAVAMLPVDIGQAALGEQWGPARQVLLPLSATFVLQALAVGPMIGLRTLAAADRSLRVTIVAAGIGITTTTAGVLQAGALGAAWAAAATSAAALALWIAEFRSAVARRSVSASG